MLQGAVCAHMRKALRRRRPAAGRLSAWVFRTHVARSADDQSTAIPIARRTRSFTEKVENYPG